MAARLATLLFAALPFAAQPLPAAEQSQFTTPAVQDSGMRFRDMDRNNDGVIAQSEWRGSLESFRYHDWNGDGVLSGDEVRPGVGPRGAVDEREFDREERFEDLDVNRDNRIERGEWHGSADAFTWLDRDRDGSLSRAEVVGSTAARGRTARRRWDPPPPVSTTGQQGDCVSSAPKVVDDIYQQVLERSADEASASLTQDLAAGRATVREIVARVAKSDEHEERFFWQPLVRNIYQQVMRREPNEQELRDTASALAAGRRQPAEVVARVAARATNNDEEAVRILYRRLLGREADEQGLRGFTDLARREGIEAVARDMIASPEYKQRAGTSGIPGQDAALYQSAVRSLYRHVLGRDPDPDGLEDLTRIAMGSGFDAVIDRMIASSEYTQMYGDDTVPGRRIRYCGPTR